MAKQFKPGDRVRLAPYRTRRVPGRLISTWATVVHVTTQNNLVVRADADLYGTRLLKPHGYYPDIVEHVPSGNNG